MNTYLQSGNLLKDRTLLFLLGFAAIIVLVFSLFGTNLSAPLSLVWVILLIPAIRNKPYRALPILLVLACYERPVLDFGLGIRGTIKLVDLFVLALVVANLLGLSRNGGAHRSSNTLQFLIPAILIAIASAAFVVTSAEFPADAKNRSIYYLVLFLEYIIAYWVIQKISIEQNYLRQSIGLFCFALFCVSIVAILQGNGILPNGYYTSLRGVETNISDKWAIGTLGPNHSHIGSYMAVGFMFAVSLMQYKFRLVYLLYIFGYCAAVGYAHSTVGIAMIFLYLLLFFVKAKGTIRLYSLFAGGLLAIFLVFYSGGYFGEESARTSNKVGVGGENSEVYQRAISQPIRMLGGGYVEKPAAILFGFGFRVPDHAVPGMKPTGDNTYFSVAMDVGLIGLLSFVMFMVAVTLDARRANSHRNRGFVDIFKSHGRLLIYVVIIAMFFQEIVWPLHSRGSTMLVFLVLFDLATRSYALPSKNNRAPTKSRQTAV